MTRHLVLVFSLVLGISGFASLPANAEGGGGGGSTGHGPFQGSLAAVLRMARSRIRSRPDCRNYLPEWSAVETDPDHPRFTRDIIFSDGSSIMSGIFVPSPGGYFAAEAVCAVVANAGLNAVPSIEECEEFADCLGL